MAGRNVVNGFFPLRFEWEFQRLLGFIYNMHPPTADPMNDYKLLDRSGNVRIKLSPEQLSHFKNIDKLRPSSM